MALATGVGNSVSYAKESAWRAGAQTVFQNIRDLDSASALLTRSQIRTAEVNSRRSVTSIRLGTKKSRVSSPTEMFFSGVNRQFDDYMESWANNPWGDYGGGVVQSAVTISFGTLGATTPLTVTSGVCTTAAILNTWIKIGGCSSALNNGYYKVVAWSSATAFTIATPDYLLTPLTTGAQGAACTITAFAQSNASMTLGAIGATTTVTTTTPADSQLTSAILGGWIRLAGCSTAANNGFYKVVAFTSSSSFSIATPNGVASGMVAGAQGAAVVISAQPVLKPGTTIKSLTFEERQVDGAGADLLYKYIPGSMADSFSLSIVPDQIVGAQFEFTGGGFGLGTTRAAALTASGISTVVVNGGTYNPAPTNSPMTANDSLMYLMVNNAVVAIVTNIKIDGKNSNEDLFPVGALSPYAVAAGTSEVTGSMDIYLVDSTFWSNYQSETTVALTARLMDPDTASPGLGYALDLPVLKLTNLTTQMGPTKVVQSVTFSVTEKAVGDQYGIATVNLALWRLQ